MIKKFLLTLLFVLFFAGCAFYHVPGHGVTVAPLLLTSTHYHTSPVVVTSHHHGMVTKRVVRKRYGHKHPHSHHHKYRNHHSHH
jgi:hypothetical protein